MPKFTRSSAFRLALFYSMAFALVTLALVVGMFFAMRTELRRELDQRVIAERESVVRQASSGNLNSIVTYRTEHGGEDLRFAVLGSDGRLLAGRPVVRAPKTGWSNIDFRDDDGGPDPARVYASALPGGGMLIVGIDPESVEHLDNRMAKLFAGAFGLITLIGIAGGFLLSSILSRRVDAITGAAEAIIGGDMAQRMPVAGTNDEFDRLSATLNRMLDRITGLMDNLRQVSGDIAHDLRTPLTRLRHKLELPLASGASPEAMSDAIHDAVDQTDEILALFTAILGISEVEAGGLKLQHKPVDLSTLAHDIADSYGPAAEDGGRSIARDIAPDIAIDGSRELLAQLLVNLLDNALRHTPEGAAIDVCLVANDNDVVLTVADNGPGIPVADRERVFARFTRLEGSRSTPGHGLGLSLVAAIATAHHATINLEDNRPGVKIMVQFTRSAA